MASTFVVIIGYREAEVSSKGQDMLEERLWADWDNQLIYRSNWQWSL
jgi:hypothetical protein